MAIDGPTLLKHAARVLLGLVAVVLLLGAVLYATAPRPGEASGWALGPPLPEARGELATAVAHTDACPEPPCPELERLYVIGGLAGLARTQDLVHSYQPGGRGWAEEPSLPAPRHHPAAVGFGEYVYVSGGTVDVAQPWAPEDDFWRLRVGTDQWEVLPAMPEGRFGHRMVELDGRLYVVGGEGPTSRVLIYQAMEGWTTGADMPAPRDHLSAVVVDGRIWAIGGRRPHSVARVDIYDPRRDAWDPGPDLPQPTSGAAEAVVDGLILIFGGEEPALLRGRVFNRHWLLDTHHPYPAWRAAPAPPLAVHGADGAVFQETVVIVGGAGRHGLLSITSWTAAFQILEHVTRALPGRWPVEDAAAR